MLRLSGKGLRHSRHLAVAFLQGATRIEVQARFEEGTVVCTTPRWPVEPVEGELSTSAIVEVSLNGQEWSTSSRRFTFYDYAPTSVEPPVGAAQGGTVLKLLFERQIITNKYYLPASPARSRLL